MSVKVAPPCGSVFMLMVHDARSFQMGASRHPSRSAFLRAERAADVLQHRQRLGTSAIARRLAAQAHQPLVFRLVVPVRQEHGHQRQRVGVDARGGRHLGQFMKRPASAVGRFDLLARELALDRHPLEVHRRVVVQATGEQLLRADQRHDLQRREREMRAAVASHALDKRHAVGGKAQASSAGATRRPRHTVRGRSISP